MKDTKTTPNAESVTKFIATIKNSKSKADSKILIQILESVTGEKPVMWGTSIIGFGTHHYKYESGREGDTMAVGFSPRKQALVLYGLGINQMSEESIKGLGKSKTSKGCLYIKDLTDVNTKVLRQLIATAYNKRNTKKQ